MSNFKTLQSTIQDSSDSPKEFTPFSPSNNNSPSQSNKKNMRGSVPQNHQVTEAQKLQKQIEVLTHQNQLLQEQLQEAQQYQQQAQLQLQDQERQMLEKMNSYQDVMRIIEEAHQSSSRDIRDNFLQLLEGILQGVFASSVIMDAALYSSLYSVVEDLQELTVVLNVHQDQFDIAQNFVKDVGVQNWSIQRDETLAIGGFRIESQLSQWLQSPQDSVKAILTKIESHLQQ